MNNMTNSVQLIGNLGRDVEFKSIGENNALAKVSIATTERRRDKEGNLISETQWHNLIGWGKTAERMNKLFKKGTRVAIQGKLTHGSFEGKDGSKRFFTDIVVRDFMLMEAKRETA